MRIILTIALYYLSLHSFAQIYKGSSSWAEQDPIIRGSAVQLAQNDEVDIPIGFDFTAYGKTYNSIYWNKDGVFFFSNGPFSSIGDTLTLINVIDAFDFNLGNIELEGNTVIYYDLIVKEGQQVCVVRIKDLELPIYDDNDVEVDRIYFSVQVELWEKGDLTLHYFDVTYDDINNYTYYPNYLIGFGQLTTDPNNPDEPINSKYNLAISSFDIQQEVQFINELTRAYVREWLYEGFFIKFSPNQNFYFSNLNHYSNQSIINLNPFSITTLLYIDRKPQGMNKYQDKGLVSKYVFDYPVELKGLATHNSGEYLEQNDSIEFVIMDFNEYGEPGQIIYSQKHNANCLLLDGSVNQISFDSSITIMDSCFIGFILPEYSYTQSNPGINFQYTISELSIDYDEQITYIKMFNDEWMSTVSGRTNSERFNVSLDSDEDLLVPAIFPIVSNINTGDSLNYNTFCDPIGLNVLDENQQGILMYPSFIKRGEELVIQSKHKITTIVVVDQMGREYKHFSGNGIERLSFSDLAEGVYFVKGINELGVSAVQQIHYGY